MWECPDCQERASVPGTEPAITTDVPRAPSGTKVVSDGDAGGGKERKR
jgi:hypothetical protein